MSLPNYVRKRIARYFGGAILVCGVVAGACAQALPATIRIVVGFPAGAANDVAARIAAEGMARHLKIAVIVENAPGANGIIAQDRVLHGPADGSMLLLASINNLLSDIHARSNKVMDSLVPLGNIGSVPFVLVGRSGMPATTDELVRHARKSQLTLAGTGLGTFAHINTELLQRAMGARIDYVPYKGAANTMTDLIGGHVDLGFVGLTSVMPHLKAGSMRIYGLASVRRSPMAPEIPSLLESQLLKDMKPMADAWQGLLVSNKAPLETRRALASALEKTMASEDIQQRIRQSGAVPEAMDSAQLLAAMRRDMATAAAIVKAANIKPE